MPLEIRELIIKATVDKDGSAPSGTENSEGSGGDKINEIVEKVFEILKEKSER